MASQTRGYITRRDFLAAMAVAASSVALFGSGRAFADGEVERGKLCIVSTNDVHCRIEPYPDDCTPETQQAFGYAGVGTAFAEAKAKYGESNAILVDCGDFAQGLSTGTLTQGEALVSLMNDAGYSFATIGNHEFDYGIDRLKELLGKAKFAPVCCNLTNTKTQKRMLDAYQIKEFTDAAGAIKKVAFLGIATPETLTKTNPAKIKDESGNYLVDFAGDDTGQKLYDCVQGYFDQARKQDGADYVVVLAHLGQEAALRWCSQTLVANTTGIKVLLDGHSHQEYVQTEVLNKEGEAVTIVQAGTQLSAAGKVVLDLSTGEVTSAELIKPYVAPETTMAKYVKEVVDSLATIKSKKIGKSQYSLYAFEEDGYTWAVRAHETNLADLVSDAYRIEMDAEIGFANGGGIRSNLVPDKDGVVTYGDCLDVNPFSNTLAVVKATGQTIVDALEMGVRKYPLPSGGFLHPSGLTYQMNPDVASPIVVDDQQNFVRVDGARRVHDVKVGDDPIDLAKTYTVACNSYIVINGGDGFTMWKDAEVVVAEGTVDFQVLSNYVERIGTIGEGYANRNGQGRVTLAATPQPEPEPQPEPQPQPTPDPSGDETGGQETSQQVTSPQTADGSTPVLATASAVAVAAAAGVVLKANA